MLLWNKVADFLWAGGEPPGCACGVSWPNHLSRSTDLTIQSARLKNRIASQIYKTTIFKKKAYSYNLKVSGYVYITTTRHIRTNTLKGISIPICLL
ncbi:hypothetical protein BIV59_02050 [Bacillus sp. MUM 13]|nr:hypothetical protein BIV59_02050 [Bacillus sp. MUM 13]